MKNNQLALVAGVILTLPAILEATAPPGGGTAPAASPEQNKILEADKPLPAKTDLADQKPSDLEERVEKLLSQLTQEEKISMIAGNAKVYDTTVGVDRLGIPMLLMSDGGRPPMSPCCVFPSAVALAATWDRDVAQENGAAFGLEARARGVHINLYPGVNISRVPTCGRNFEYFGEDPFLAGKMVSSYVRGIENEGVAATIKHFACNNQEYWRQSVSAEVDERTLQEIYLPAFHDAVKEGNVSFVMCSYNRVNGVYSSANDHLMKDILKDRWGFKGAVLSDWTAVMTSEALGHGTDIEMPSPKYFSPENVLKAIEKKTFTQAQLDDSVRRLLRVIVAKGFMDRPQKRSELPLDSPASSAVALKVAREAVVLLKNQDRILPIDRSKCRKIAVFGVRAADTRSLGYGSGEFHSLHKVDFLNGIRKAAGSGIAVQYVPPAPSAPDYKTFPLCRTTADGEPGLNFNLVNGNMPSAPSGPPTVVKNVDFTRTNAMDTFLGVPPDQTVEVCFSGALVAPEDSDWEIIAPHMKCSVDGKVIKEREADEFINRNRDILHLKKGVPVPVAFTGLIRPHAETKFKATIRPVAQPDVSAARDADVAVVIVGRLEGEGRDCVFDLGEDDLRLIQAVSAANPRTIVVNQSAAAVEMASWISKPAAVLQSWFLGQEGGTALGEILFGDVNPSGHLPVTFERRLEDYPAMAKIPEGYPGCRPEQSYPKVFYSEGIFVGYRGTDKAQREPLFPFGFGLSYTTFSYEKIQLHVDKDGEDPMVTVQFDVKNSGSVAGAAVPQVYVSDKHSSVPRPVRELKGFTRVELAPGESKTVTVQLKKDAFAYYDVTKHGWKVEPGEFQISVGESSHDLRLDASVTLK